MFTDYLREVGGRFTLAAQGAPMFKKTWDNYPIKTGAQVMLDTKSRRWVPVEQVFTAFDQKFLASINWASDRVVVSV